MPKGLWSFLRIMQSSIFLVLYFLRQLIQVEACALSAMRGRPNKAQLGCGFDHSQNEMSGRNGVSLLLSVLELHLGNLEQLCNWNLPVILGIGRTSQSRNVSFVCEPNGHMTFDGDSEEELYSCCDVYCSS